MMRPALAKAGKVLGAPMSLMPVSARDAVGYLAAVTLFNALAVWAYMLLIHSPAIPPPAHDAPALHSKEPPPKHDEASHAEKDGAHGPSHGPADAAHDPSHETPHANAPASHADEPHHGSEPAAKPHSEPHH